MEITKIDQTTRKFYKNKRDKKRTRYGSLKSTDYKKTTRGLPAKQKPTKTDEQIKD